MPALSQPASDPLLAARDALNAHEWLRGLELFRQADGLARLGPEDLESMGEAAWWAARPDEAIDALQRAYAAYVEAGKPARAAYVALSLAREYGVKLASSVAAGWFKRAKRLLESEPEGVEHGYLYARQAFQALGEGRLDEAIRLAQLSVEVGDRMGDPNLRAIGTVYQGGALVEKGEVAEGLSLIDDAAVAAVSGELGFYATGMVYCNTISMCCEITDFRRAGDWSEAARQWSESHPRHPLVPGDCRVHQAEILALRGDWAEAEESARRGAEELRAFNRLYHVGEALYQIGAIRLRMGDLPAADDAFRQASELGRDPQPGMSVLALAEGRVDAAMASIRRALDEETASDLARGRLLPAFVQISLRSGDIDAAREAADELQAIAAKFDTPARRAASEFARGAVLLATGEAKEAARHLRLSIKWWNEVEAPYDAAQGRALLGRAIARQRDTEGAILELRAARAAFQKLGAPDASGIEAELLELEGKARSPGGVKVVKAFVFTDIVKSTNLVEAIGDEAWLDLIRWHDQTLRTSFAEHSGTELDHAGDGFFVVFDAANAAIECAVAIQRRLAEHRRVNGFAPHVRMGVHVAPANRSGGSYVGKGVHEAARIAAAAEGGVILVSRSSLELMTNRFAASPPRELRLRGISKPVEVIAIDWRSGVG